jgi:hypothetical protein
LALDPAKPLDINAIEAGLDDLLEHYRQALRAVELLPCCRRVPDNECTVQIRQPVGPARNRILHADWIRNRSAVRRLTRMFLRSHIQSKLRTIADRLEVERFAGGHMDANTLKRLDDIIKKLGAYDKSFTQRRTFWSRLPGWVWPVAAPILFTALYKYFATLTVTASGVLAYIATYLLGFVLFVWAPLYLCVALGGFRWKRLILLGQTGDMNIYVPNVVLRWVRGPQANTYESENRFFATLGLPKPDEFPWDRVLEPPPFLSTALVLAFFMVVLAINVPAKEFSLPLLIVDVVFVAFLILYLHFIVRPIFRAMRERRQRSAC